MFDCETSIERVSHKARLDINLLCCAISSKTCPTCGLKSRKIPIWRRQRGSEGKHTLYINKTVVKIYVESGVESLNINHLDNSQNVEATTCDTYQLP